jgi:hypothetical protein
MFDTRASLPNEVRADIEQFLENARGTDSAWAQARIIPTFIRRNIKLAEAPSYGKTIFEYEPDCNGARDYWNVARCVHADFQPVPEVDMPRPAAVEEAQDEADSEEHPPPQPELTIVEEIQEPSSPVEPSPSQPQYVDIDEIQEEPESYPAPQPERHTLETESHDSEPPIRIEPVPQTERQQSDDFTQATGEPDKPESTQTDHGFNRF